MSPDEPAGVGIPTPTVELVTVDDPVEAAPALAAARCAELIFDDASVQRAIDSRRTPRHVGESGIAELRRLADELARAQRIRSRTEEGFRDVLSQRLARSGNMAVHPVSIRNAAEAILEAERDLAEATAELTARRPAPSEGPDDAPHGRAEGARRGDEPATDGEPPLDDDALASRRLQLLGFAFAGAAAVVGLVLLAFGIAWQVVISIAVLSIVCSLVVSVIGARRGRAPRSDPSPAPEVAEPSPLQQLVGFPPTAGDDDATPREVDPLRDLELARQRAEERLRIATHSWESLVGRDADPHDVEAVLRSHDAQYDLASAGSTSPTVRAVSALHRRSAARWRVAWATLGYDAPPPDDRIEIELQRLRVAGPKPVLFVDPQSWIAPEALAAVLRDLPAGTDVTIVSRRLAAGGGPGHTAGGGPAGTVS